MALSSTIVAFLKRILNLVRRPNSRVPSSKTLEEEKIADGVEEPAIEVTEPEVDEPVDEQPTGKVEDSVVEEATSGEPIDEQPTGQVDEPAVEDPVGVAEQSAAPGAAGQLEEPAVEEDEELAAEEPISEELSGQPRLLAPPNAYRHPVPNPRQRRSQSSGSEENRGRDPSRLEIAVRVKFDRRTGFCSLSLLPRRVEGTPESVTVTYAEGEFNLTGLGRNWYQDVQLENMGTILKDGTRWAATASQESPTEWQLTGRSIYVLGSSDEISGFVNQTRLEVGKPHTVICTTEILPDVLQMITKTGSPNPENLDSSMGMPPGWVALRGVQPSTGLEQELSAGILGILYPFPEVAINFEGGINIGQSTWLAGFPPTIRLSGRFDEIDDIQVDRLPVLPPGSGVLTAAGWDKIGDHVVYCGGITRSYSISRGLEIWDRWDARTIGTRNRGFDNNISICGTLVSESGDSNTRMIFTDQNPILLGQIPGEIYECRRSPDIPGVPYVGFPAFMPVWSLPKNIDTGDKARMEVILMNNHPPGPVPTLKRRSMRRINDPVVRWSRTIGQAMSRRLPIRGDLPQVGNLWRQYKQSAKQIRKMLRR